MKLQIKEVEKYKKKMVHLVGLEPATFWSVARRSIQLSYRCTE